MNFEKITYDIPEGLFYFTIKEKEGVCETVVTEGSLIHLDEDGDWIGFDIIIGINDLKESFPNLSDQRINEMLVEMNVNNPYCWRNTTIFKSIKQELIVDFDIYGLIGVEVILFSENLNIGMKWLEANGSDISR